MPSLSLDNESPHFRWPYDVDGQTPSPELTTRVESELAIMSRAVKQLVAARGARDAAEESYNIAQSSFRESYYVRAPEGHVFLVQPPKYWRNYTFIKTDQRRLSCPYNETIETKSLVESDGNDDSTGFVVTLIEACEDDEELGFRAAYHPRQGESREFKIETIALNGRERITLIEANQIPEGLELLNQPAAQQTT